MRVLLITLLSFLSFSSFAEETDWAFLSNINSDDGVTSTIVVGTIDGQNGAFLRLDLNNSQGWGVWGIQFNDSDADPFVEMLDIKLQYIDGATKSLKPQMEMYLNASRETAIVNTEGIQQAIYYYLDIEFVNAIKEAEYLVFEFQRQTNVEEGSSITQKFTLANYSVIVNDLQKRGEEIRYNLSTVPSEITAESQAKAQAEAEAEKQRQAELVAQQEAEKQRQLEQERLEAEAAQREVEAQREKYRQAFNDFDWSSGCGSAPSMPGNNASDYTIDKFNSRYDNWVECQNDMVGEDTETIRDLVLEIGGTWEWTSSNESSWEWQIPNACECYDRIKRLHEFRVDRAERRVDRIDRMNDAIDDSNDAADRAEFWNDINNSIDESFREIERQDRESWDRIYNQPYHTPGLN